VFDAPSARAKLFGFGDSRSDGRIDWRGAAPGISATAIALHERIAAQQVRAVMGAENLVGLQVTRSIVRQQLLFSTKGFHSELEKCPIGHTAAPGFHHGQY
jgi:hypothetical protein